MIRIYACLAAVILIIGSMIYVDHRGYERGKLECQAQRAVQADKVQAAIDLRDQSSATERVTMLDYLRVTIPPIEVRTYETVERIKTIYRDRVITADCAASIQRDPRVRDEINQARERANSAISAMRRTTPIASAADPRPVGHGWLGSHGDGFVRDRSNPVDSYERMPGEFAGVWSD